MEMAWSPVLGAASTIWMALMTPVEALPSKCTPAGVTVTAGTDGTLTAEPAAPMMAAGSGVGGGGEGEGEGGGGGGEGEGGGGGDGLGGGGGDGLGGGGGEAAAAGGGEAAAAGGGEAGGSALFRKGTGYTLTRLDSAPPCVY